LGGEVTLQDKLNLLRLQIRQAQEAARKLPDMINQLRATCPHAEVLEWVGNSGRNRYRLCTFCGKQDKARITSGTWRTSFVGDLHYATPTIVSREEGERAIASLWSDAVTTPDQQPLASRRQPPAGG
jgi:hypothetical protein